MKKINGREMLNLLEDTANGKSRDYKYQDDHPGEACRYVSNGEPACIVGVALITGGKMEWPKYVVSDYKDTALNGPFDSVATEVGALNHVEFTPGAITVATAAQAVQDNGGTWKLAVQVARSVWSTLGREETTRA